MKPFNIFAILITLLCASACREGAPSVLYVLPPGFRGLFRISEDRAAGTDLRAETGEYTINVPSNGVVLVKSLRPISVFHKEMARFSTGQEIHARDASIGGGDLVFSGVGFIDGAGIYYFVGTKAEHDQVSKAFDLRQLPLATQLAPDTKGLRQ